MKQLEFERLFFPIQVRCQALDCLMNRGAIKRPERAVWQEKNTGILLCDRDKVRVEGRVMYGATTGIPWQLHDELPGGCFQPYLIVDKISS